METFAAAVEASLALGRRRVRERALARFSARAIAQHYMEAYTRVLRESR
jgi:hypothetical protein